ncbi:2Fe-2S iron-sulfur cluster binding domain-containing protein [Duganella sp. FT92W]|uniref:2Fe-2S iron-sulfur cluster binding domain-containing protein n=1 Tax=Pseudoduganella rivuli TaxID=2666085 RepID=A0A7X2ITX0_9BURK|nr:2Fe-2S iron-sulfur cluster binding domain-containing protein [Pseudoduganella rivuli]MRV75860.1 2Fe-2S iron-sulfur cluster binding domain-containing protein [Pseudoduganella rivuli]
MRATLASQDWTFDTDGTTTLLRAAEQGGIRLPSSCRNGTCRTCLCKLESGAIRYLIEWPGVSREEKHEGLILPCVAVAETDVVLNVPAARRIPG